MVQKLENIEKFTLNFDFLLPNSHPLKVLYPSKRYFIHMQNYLSFPSPPFPFFPYFSLSLFYFLLLKILSLLNCIIVLKLYYFHFPEAYFYLMVS